MDNQDKYEPKYPKNQEECDLICHTLVNTLSEFLNERLVCIILSGSWATGEANPPNSDVDLTIVVKELNKKILSDLALIWAKTEIGYVNIYDLIQVKTMSKEAFHMYTTNAKVLYGSNPFDIPTRDDFAHDLTVTAETLVRMSRHLIYAYWLTEKEVIENLDYIFSKECLNRCLLNLIAFREGIYPKKSKNIESIISNHPEVDLVRKINRVPKEKWIEHYIGWVAEINEMCSNWFKEIYEFRNKKTDTGN